MSRPARGVNRIVYYRLSYVEGHLASEGSRINFTMMASGVWTTSTAIDKMTTAVAELTSSSTNILPGKASVPPACFLRRVGTAHKWSSGRRHMVLRIATSFPTQVPEDVSVSRSNTRRRTSPSCGHATRTQFAVMLPPSPTPSTQNRRAIQRSNPLFPCVAQSHVL